MRATLRYEVLSLSDNPKRRSTQRVASFIITVAVVAAAAVLNQFTRAKPVRNSEECQKALFVALSALDEEIADDVPEALLELIAKHVPFGENSSRESHIHMLSAFLFWRIDLVTLGCYTFHGLGSISGHTEIYNVRENALIEHWKFQCDWNHHRYVKPDRVGTLVYRDHDWVDIDWGDVAEVYHGPLPKFNEVAMQPSGVQKAEGGVWIFEPPRTTKEQQHHQQLKVNDSSLFTVKIMHLYLFTIFSFPCKSTHSFNAHQIECTRVLRIVDSLLLRLQLIPAAAVHPRPHYFPS